MGDTMLLDILTPAKHEFLEHCHRIRGLSQNTVDAYEQDIMSFAVFARTRLHLQRLDSQAVLAYLDYLRRERNLKPATVRRRMVTLRAFATWLRKAGQVEQDPFAGLEIDLRPPRRLPRPVEWIDVQTMLKADCNVEAGAPAPHREPPMLSSTTAMAIKLMVATGVRVGELTRIKLSDISNDGFRIRINGKGSKERTVYIGNRVLRAELQNIKRQTHPTVQDDRYLLLNKHRRRLTEQALRRRLRLLAAACNLDTPVTPHRFRHSAATFLIEGGVDIRFVQRLLGHSSIATTEIYTRVSDTALMQAVDDADTLGRMLSEFT